MVQTVKKVNRKAESEEKIHWDGEKGRKGEKEEEEKRRDKITLNPQRKLTHY